MSPAVGWQILDFSGLLHPELLLLILLLHLPTPWTLGLRPTAVNPYYEMWLLRSPVAEEFLVSAWDRCKASILRNVVATDLKR